MTTMASQSELNGAGIGGLRGFMGLRRTVRSASIHHNRVWRLGIMSTRGKRVLHVRTIVIETVRVRHRAR